MSIEKESFKNILNNIQESKINSQINIDIPDYLENLPNLIIYGPPASGKYCESLKIIEKFSPSHLKYEKKIIVNFHKNSHIIKISDIHYEINLENLTCNSKILFNEIYSNILDSIETSINKQGIILYKNFHYIDNELLDVFYSYIQKIINNNKIIKHIILTEHICLISKNILNVCHILNIQKLSISNYIKLANDENKKIIKNFNNIEKNNFLNTINNINIIKYKTINNGNENILDLKYKYCNIIIDIILNNKINFINIRNSLYDLLIYNLNIHECIFYILENIINKYKNLNNDFLNKIFIKTCNFFKFYNNNYRPIYHLESYILYIINILHNNESE
tara:strand:+ start:450 stop:1457 length:1008 start_codon:yes stop_codon:yes gene_type:complete